MHFKSWFPVRTAHSREFVYDFCFVSCKESQNVAFRIYLHELNSKFHVNRHYRFEALCFIPSVIQLFQITLSDQSIKLEDKTARLCGILKFIKTSYATPVQWRFTMASHLEERNFRISRRWGSSSFEDSLGLVHTVMSSVVFRLGQENISELYSVPVLTD